MFKLALGFITNPIEGAGPILSPTLTKVEHFDKKQYYWDLNKK